MNIHHLAILGKGSIGNKHARLIAELYPSLSVSQFQSRQRADFQSTDRFINSIVQSQSESLVTPQVAIICSPASFHIEDAAHFLRHGVHLLIEKPLSDNCSGVDQFKHEVLQSNLHVHVAYVLRNHPCIAYLREVLHKHDLVDGAEVKIVASSFLPSWRGGKSYLESVSARKELGGGALLELSHEVDYAQWLFGKIHTISANLYTEHFHNLDVEDSAELHAKTEQNANIQIHLDFRSEIPHRYCTIRTTRGEIHCNLLTQEVSSQIKDLPDFSRSFTSDSEYLFKQQIKNFLAQLTQKPDYSSILDSIHVMRVIEAARASSKDDKAEVKVI